MERMTFIRALAAATFLAALLAAQPANAEPVDTRPCVTPRELWITPGGLSRDQVEHRWEVQGEGVRYNDPIYGRVYAYKICDESFSRRWALAQFDRGMIVGVATVKPS